MSELPYYSPKSVTSLENFKGKDYSWIYIGILVIFLHLLLPWLSQLSSAQPIKSTRNKVIVQTVRLSPQSRSIRQPDQSNLLASLESPVAKPILTSPQENPASSANTGINQVPDFLPEESIKLIPETISKPERPSPSPSPTAHISRPEPPKQTPKPLPKKPVTKAIPKQENKPAPVKKPTGKIELKVPPKVTDAEKMKKEAQQRKKTEQAKEAEKKAVEKQESERKKQKEEEAEAEVKRKQEERETARRREILSDAQEKLSRNQESRNKLSANQSVKSTESALPTEISNLRIDAFVQEMGDVTKWSVKEPDYQDEVAEILRAGLRLPEYGAVKIELMISRTGKVERMKVLSSESTKNKQYLEQTVARLKFGAFGSRFQNQESYTFSVILNNERKN